MLQSHRSPTLPLSAIERRALRRAGLVLRDLAWGDPRAISRVTEGKISVTRAHELCSLAELQLLPNIGPSLAADLLRLGIRSPARLRGRDPVALYRRLERLKGPQDPCVLDAFASAIWHAEHPDAAPRPWWRWSRARLAAGS